MKKALFSLTFALLACAGGGVANAQTSQAMTGAMRAAQQHLIGEVTAFDPAAGHLTVKTDAGASVTVTTDERTSFRRVPPGQTSLEGAERITSADVRLGDRVLIPNGATGGQGAARQVIVMAREAIASKQQQERDDWRTRGIGGRVLAIDPAKRELTVETRSREGAQTVTVVASADVRFRRFAPGSLRTADAVAGAFSDVRVGDQVRVLGNREGARVTAEEIISGTVARLSGTIEAVDASRGELTVKEMATGQVVTVALGKDVNARRLPADIAQTFGQGRGERRRGGDSAGGQGGGARPEGQRGERGGRRGRGGEAGRGPGPGGGGGRGTQQLFESLPTVTIAELKKGDGVFVTGTTGADASRVTAAMLVTGDAEILRRLQRFQRGPSDMSPGLPSGVVGGGTGADRDQP